MVRRPDDADAAGITPIAASKIYIISTTGLDVGVGGEPISYFRLSHDFILRQRPLPKHSVSSNYQLPRHLE
jgi:hypothetical protein